MTQHFATLHALLESYEYKPTAYNMPHQHIYAYKYVDNLSCSTIIVDFSSIKTIYYNFLTNSIDANTYTNPLNYEETIHDYISASNFNDTIALFDSY